jgi:hypothetical protein
MQDGYSCEGTISTAAQRAPRLVPCGTAANHAEASRYTLTRSLAELIAEEAAAGGACEAAHEARGLAARSGRRIAGAAIGRS